MRLKSKYFMLYLLALLSFSTLCFSSTTSQTGRLTTLQPGVSIYSEYYSNPIANFKGTIIFENGSGEDMSEWGRNQQFFSCVKKLGNIFLYDRNGLGKSPPDFQLSPQNPLTAALVSHKLWSLLQKLKIKPPYIIVAHSYGAIYAGYFALQHPNNIKSVVLVDPVPRNFNFSDKLLANEKSGLMNANKMSSVNIYKKYNGSDAELIYQLLGFENTKLSLMRLGNISDKIPITIISSTGMEKEKPLKEDWFNSQKQWLNKNHKSKIIQVQSGHYIQLMQPQVVCNAIKDLAS